QVIILDANLLLYAYDAGSPFHERSRAWLQTLFSGSIPVGIPWQTVGAFLRISTHLRLPGRFSSGEALSIVSRWFDQPNVRALSPAHGHWALLSQMISEGQAQGPLVTDAQLAALAIEHGGVLHTTDRDFARFPGLRWKNPLAEA
ncbi:MAG: PIN domain-containing protein, partial [Acidobacteriota bacterium]|nr:PIN domain-containing protein [Acidobacteriota bacterium]